MHAQLFLPLLALGGMVAARPNATPAYKLCQTACNIRAVACYSAAGLVFGTVVADAAALPVALRCNAALGKCAADCALDTDTTKYVEKTLSQA
ncbi:hypothetical protein B0H14DRAFT_2802403 [Mycena olivaceomarginata]|nr:hypothetical protein B0H14DRAFT_2802403 [Mycena olivaceomarginata]